MKPFLRLHGGVLLEKLLWKPEIESSERGEGGTPKVLHTGCERLWAACDSVDCSGVNVPAQRAFLGCGERARKVGASPGGDDGLQCEREVGGEDWVGGSVVDLDGDEGEGEMAAEHTRQLLAEQGQQETLPHGPN